MLRDLNNNRLESLKLCFFSFLCGLRPGGGGGLHIMEGVGMLEGNFELNP